MIKNRNFYLIILFDVLAVIASFYLAYAIRFDFDIPPWEKGPMVHILPLVVCVKMVTFVFFRLYRGMWRYTGLFDIINVVKAIFISSMSIVIIVLLMYRFRGYPRSVFIIDFIISLILITGIRVAIRLYFSANSIKEIFSIIPWQNTKGKKLMIIGAGNTGERVIREIMENPRLKLNPVGFLDDRPEKRGKTIHGISVLGSIDEIKMWEGLFDEILIAIPSASANQMRKIVMACESTGKPFLTVPAMSELIDGKISVTKARNVTLADLLGRQEVKISKKAISDFLYGKRVLISGAGGSIGSELVRQVLRFKPEAVGLLDVSEFNLFCMESECKNRFFNHEIKCFLTDVKDRKAIEMVYKKFKPDIVFHAAAYKHVPMQERHPWEAVKNNVFGTKNMVEAACENSVSKFVMVSTDKAVRPTSVMGATKRVAEKLVTCVNRNGYKIQCMVVRFGNVIGSSGSVVPVFQEQIERGGPVTVTHPDVTRFFMTIPEAARLILEAVTKGKGGETFILEMGEPVRILDLAKDLIRLHGYEPEKDIAIEYTGLRPGEKLYEELITDDEGVIRTDHKKIMVIEGNICEPNDLNSKIKELLAKSEEFDGRKIREKLKDIVPEYNPEYFEMGRK